MARRDRTKLDTRLRCGLRYRLYYGTYPVLVSWPLARMFVSADAIRFRIVFPRVFRQPNWVIQRVDIQSIEPTGNGLRFYVAGFKDPWVVAHPTKRRFLRRLACLGIIPEGPVRRSTWTSL